MATDSGPEPALEALRMTRPKPPRRPGKRIGREAAAAAAAPPTRLERRRRDAEKDNRAEEAPLEREAGLGKRAKSRGAKPRELISLPPP